MVHFTKQTKNFSTDFYFNYMKTFLPLGFIIDQLPSINKILSGPSMFEILDKNSQKFFMKLSPNFHGKFSLFPHSTQPLSLSTLNYFNFHLWKPRYFDCGCMCTLQRAQRHQRQLLFYTVSLLISPSPLQP